MSDRNAAARQRLKAKATAKLVGKGAFRSVLGVPAAKSGFLGAYPDLNTWNMHKHLHTLGQDSSLQRRWTSMVFIQAYLESIARNVEAPIFLMAQWDDANFAGAVPNMERTTSWGEADRRNRLTHSMCWALYERDCLPTLLEFASSQEVVHVSFAIRILYRVMQFNGLWALVNRKLPSLLAVLHSYMHRTTDTMQRIPALCVIHQVVSHHSKQAEFVNLRMAEPLRKRLGTINVLYLVDWKINPENADHRAILHYLTVEHLDKFMHVSHLSDMLTLSVFVCLGYNKTPSVARTVLLVYEWSRDLVIAYSQSSATIRSNSDDFSSLANLRDEADRKVVVRWQQILRKMMVQRAPYVIMCLAMEVMILCAQWDTELVRKDMNESKELQTAMYVLQYQVHPLEPNPRLFLQIKFFVELSRWPTLHVRGGPSSSSSSSSSTVPATLGGSSGSSTKVGTTVTKEEQVALRHFFAQAARKRGLIFLPTDKKPTTEGKEDSLPPLLTQETDPVQQEILTNLSERKEKLLCSRYECHFFRKKEYRCTVCLVVGYCGAVCQLDDCRTHQLYCDELRKTGDGHFLPTYTEYLTLPAVSTSTGTSPSTRFQPATSPTSY